MYLIFELKDLSVKPVQTAFLYEFFHNDIQDKLLPHTCRLFKHVFARDQYLPNLQQPHQKAEVILSLLMTQQYC